MWIFNFYVRTHVRKFYARVNKIKVVYGRLRINICKSNVWPSSHCLQFVYAHKLYARTHAIITRR